MPTWDELFTDEDNRWKEPHERLVAAFEQIMAIKEVSRVLDLGCGAGRHLVYLTGKGCDAFGMDISRNGLTYSKEWLIRQGYIARLVQADMTCLPFTSGFFDLVVSMYVIHHNPLEGVRRSIQEVYRLLIPGGCTILTLNSTRGFRYTKGQQLEPGTIIPDFGKDCGIPHHFTDLGEIAREFDQFIVRDIHLDEKITEEGYLSSHWFIMAEKPEEATK
jgi:SAM-dependent methyltransferase